VTDEKIESSDPERIRDMVRKRYGAFAIAASCCTPASIASDTAAAVSTADARADSCCCSGAAASAGAVPCCGSTSAGDVLAQIGYTAEQAAAIPAGTNLGLGCGNPLAFAAVQPGETVLDLGSGAGIDAFLAAREVGPTGHVLGVDMTHEMLAKARDAARRGGFSNVEFRLGEIEHLPVADASIDVIISNCVINLSPDKTQVFREALRVLRPGGRILVSDLVLVRPLSDTVRQSVAAYVGCVAGASMRDDYLASMRTAGFRDIAVVQENAYTVALESASDLYQEGLRSVASVKVRAVKP
jgi:arsenite methyltransferase